MKSPSFLILSIILLSCKDNSKVLDKEKYEGPSVSMTNIDVLISDSTRIKLRLVAGKQNDYTDGDRDFPEGIYLEFYNPLGIMTSTLKADKGHYFAEDDYYKAEGNVIMKRNFSTDELSTELLNWVPDEERIHTDHFVTIRQDGEILTGEGLEATQDLEEYTILKPSGTMSIANTSESEQGQDEDAFDESLIFEEDTTSL